MWPNTKATNYPFVVKTIYYVHYLWPEMCTTAEVVSSLNRIILYDLFHYCKEKYYMRIWCIFIRTFMQRIHCCIVKQTYFVKELAYFSFLFKICEWVIKILIFNSKSNSYYAWIVLNRESRYGCHHQLRVHCGYETRQFVATIVVSTSFIIHDFTGGIFCRNVLKLGNIKQCILGRFLIEFFKIWSLF